MSVISLEDITVQNERGYAFAYNGIIATQQRLVVMSAPVNNHYYAVWMGERGRVAKVGAIGDTKEQALDNAYQEMLKQVKDHKGNFKDNTQKFREEESELDRKHSFPESHTFEGRDFEEGHPQNRD